MACAGAILRRSGEPSGQRRVQPNPRQRIKNQLAGPEYEGVELYPAESRKVDGANQYHLWCFPFQMPFGYEDRDVVTQDLATSAVPGAVRTDPEDVDLAHGGITVDPEAAKEVRLRDARS